MYEIHLGIPEMKALWSELQRKHRGGLSSKAEERLYKLTGKAMRLISADPRHPGLQTHEITALTRRYGIKVWQSYLENNTPKAGRLYWVYGPGQGNITIIGLEPHPEDKSNAYQKIVLSSMEDTGTT
ncbi:MAG: hypothetical protein IJJ23_06075 [Clostridia bacterium]|nr:hypothetical protein [Clostridia bacterium]